MTVRGKRNARDRAPGSRTNLRRVFEKMQRKYDPLVVERDWSGDDALAVLIGGPGTVERVRATLRDRPELLEAPIAELVRELSAVPGIGRAAAVRFVAAELYRVSV